MYDLLYARATIMNRVIDVIKQVGVPQQDIETTMFRLHLHYTHPRGERSGEPRIAGFEAMNLIKVLAR